MESPTVEIRGLAWTSLCQQLIFVEIRALAKVDICRWFIITVELSGPTPMAFNRPSAVL